MKNVWKLIASIALCQGVGVLGSIVTIPAISTWYQTIKKPFFTPPNWIFGPVWTILFLLMGISLYLVWNKGLKSKKAKSVIRIFLIQLGLNFLWSLFFFGFHSPLLAFIDIIILWVAILLTILKVYKISKIAAYLLLPYLFWVTFATVLNAFFL